MDVKYVNRTGDKWFTDRAGSAPLMKEEPRKSSWRCSAMNCFLPREAIFFNAFTEGLKLWNSEISTILESRNEI